MSTNLNKTPRTFLWLTIYNRLLNQGVEPHDVDIRYLGKMDRRISKMLSKIYAYPLFTAFYNGVNCRWEIKEVTTPGTIDQHRVFVSLTAHM